MSKRNADHQKGERDIDEKDGAPGNMLDQPSARDGPNGGGDRAEARPGSNGAPPFLFGKRIADNSEAAGHQERGAKPLEGPGDDQLRYRRRKSAGGGGRGEQD